ncbi:MAG: hypothetical protein D3926_02415 [Desulfobacteraceae bacterium]|nr:MAG: hypothetical protein D3926_02415 [Desulfobacteraceae bacterium]
MDHAIEELRKQSLSKLKKHGITGANVYLIDLIPLIEMIWADGKAQEAEVSILQTYLDHHVKHINHIAGYTVLDVEAATTFIQGFLKKRPDPGLLKTLRDLIPSVRLSSTDTQASDLVKESLLAACLDIAASCVIRYPYGLSERFDPREKRCFFEIVESFKP